MSKFNFFIQWNRRSFQQEEERKEQDSKQKEKEIKSRKRVAYVLLG